jgi:hypothetical protein
MRFARILESCLGAWLASAHWVLPGATDVPGGATAIGIAVALVAVLSMAPRLERYYLHLVNGLAGLWLTGSIVLATRPVSPSGQNALLIGLLLMMLAIVPTRAFSPPRGWRQPDDID